MMKKLYLIISIFSFGIPCFSQADSAYWKPIKNSDCLYWGNDTIASMEYKYKWDGDLILESNYYKFNAEDSLLISTRKFFYEYY